MTTTFTVEQLPHRLGGHEILANYHAHARTTINRAWFRVDIPETEVLNIHGAHNWKQFVSASHRPLHLG
ncbi:MAG: hypothetical protein P8N43_10170, partial [Alphaproteobacteria bacterium]|nr:hypothetical protein [Alphaproteobacteria bacterium]